MKDLSKIKCYRCDELGHLARNCSQFRDWMMTTVAMASSDSEGDVLEIFDEVSTSSQ